MDKRNRKKKTVDDTVCEIHKFSGYAVLSNCFVRSTNLGCPAIGLLGRVMDLPPEWNFSKAGLIAICPDGETAIDSALNDLKEWGYLEVVVKMPNENPTGRIQTVYKFYEYSAKDTSIPQYDYELETFTVDNAVLNRVKKDSNFTMVSTALLRNKTIPNKLLGLLLKVRSLPDYWHFSMSGLKAICKEGRTAVHNAVNKLIDMGYLVRTQLLSNESVHNCFEYVYSFFDVPVTKEQADELEAETRRKAITIRAGGRAEKPISSEGKNRGWKTCIRTFRLLKLRCLKTTDNIITTIHYRKINYGVINPLSFLLRQFHKFSTVKMLKSRTRDITQKKLSIIRKS